MKPEQLLPKPDRVQPADRHPWVRGRFITSLPEPLDAREPLTEQGAVTVYRADSIILGMLEAKC